MSPLQGQASVFSVMQWGQDYKSFSVPISVDLSKVTMNGKPAVLDGYMVRIDFDRTRVEFLGASGGRTVSFPGPPSSRTSTRPTRSAP